MKIPIPLEMPKEYRHQYMANWLAVLYKRPCPYPKFVGRCVGCGVEGVIGSRSLTHRGEARPTNLVCSKCVEDGDETYGQSSKAAIGQRAKGGATEVEGGKPELVLKGRLQRRSGDRTVQHRKQPLSKG